MMRPLRFVFGLHVHQPIGNFDHVFETHVRDVYLPMLERLAEARCLPVALHISGPLLEWLEAHDQSRYLDLVGRLAADGDVELLLAGWYEPILAVLPRADRLEQIQWMQDALRRRFGVEATGLWLTERVWEPHLAGDLAQAGVRYAFVDDRHFHVAGFPPGALGAWYGTEADGRHLALLPIDERLRYLVPFREPQELAAYLRSRRAVGHALAVLADDGEKFGGWPGTRAWVYERGWLARFLATMRSLQDAGDVRLVRPADALREVPSGGLVYLPSASYSEMERWALPPEAALRLARLERDIGAERLKGPDGALVRGTHWRNFLVKYAESRRMHAMMLALTALCRERGDPPAARRAIARAQCNDAYWHGVFGGLYLPHLRAAIWRELAAAEAVLRRGEPLAVTVRDLDGDGHDEIWVHGGAVSLVLAPHRGGVAEVVLRLEGGVNAADTLTRRREAYHDEALAAAKVDPPHQGGAPSIHDTERGLRLTASPAFDEEERAVFVERMLAGSMDQGAFAHGGAVALHSWARSPFTAEVRGGEGEVSVVLRADGLEKTVRVAADGAIDVRYAWEPSAFPADAVFTTELSLAQPASLTGEPEAVVWSYPIVTVAKSERGLEETTQGTALLVRWPASLGAARLRVRWDEGQRSPVAGQATPAAGVRSPTGS